MPVEFKEGIVVPIMGVFFRIKKIKPAKNEMVIRRLSDIEIKQVNEYIKQKEKEND